MLLYIDFFICLLLFSSIFINNVERLLIFTITFTAVKIFFGKYFYITTRRQESYQILQRIFSHFYSRFSRKNLQPNVRAWKDKQTTIDANADLNYLVAKLWRSRNWKAEIFDRDRVSVYVYTRRESVEY